MAAVGAAFQGLRELEGVRADALENVLDALFGVAGEGGLPQVAEVLDAGAERGRVVSMLRLEQLALVEEASRLPLGEGELLGEHRDLLSGGGELLLKELWRDEGGEGDVGVGRERKGGRGTGDSPARRNPPRGDTPALGRWARTLGRRGRR